MTDKEKEVAVEVTDESAVDEGKSLAWLSYLGILLLIPLLVKPDNSFCKYHVKQGIAMVIYWIGLGVVSVIPILEFIAWIGCVVIFVFAIIGIIQSLSGKYWEAPLGIYQLSQKFTF